MRFNVAGAVSVSLLDLVEELNQLAGQALVPTHQPARSGDIRDSATDLGAARQHLGYNPLVSWQEGLKHTLHFYR